MSRPHSFHIVKWLTTICLCATGFSFANSSAEPRARFNAHVTIGGSSKPSSATDMVQPYKLTVYIGYSLPEHEEPPGGGLALFGALDSGEVYLMHHIEYIPNLVSSFTDRQFYPPKAKVAASEIPLHIMVCAWSADDGEPSEPIFRFYTEREDAHSTFSDTGFGGRWKTISSRRAKGKFAGRDYCAELAKTNRSSAPLWFPQAEY